MVQYCKTRTCRKQFSTSVADNSTNFALGNYVVEDTFDSFRNVGTANAFDKGTRVTELQTTGNQNIILSKGARTGSNNVPYCAIDHRGFVATCVITSTSNGFLFEGDISEVKVGMNICVQVDSTRNTYLRISKISQIGDNYVELDSSINNVPATRDPATGSAPSPQNITSNLKIQLMVGLKHIKEVQVHLAQKLLLGKIQKQEFVGMV